MPFSVLHISDTHFTAAYPDEDAKKQKLREVRTKTFGGRQEEALCDSLAWAKENVDYVVHTGDLIDWQSRANFDLVKKHFGAGLCGAVGNHEFSPDMWLGKDENSEAHKAKTRAPVAAAYPFDIELASTVVNGVNFVTLDDVYGYVTAHQVDDGGEVRRDGGRLVVHRDNEDLAQIHVNRTSWPWNMKFPPTTYCIAVGEKRSCTVMCRCPARMAFRSGSRLREAMKSRVPTSVRCLR